MINKSMIEQAQKYCKDFIYQIENFEKAITSDKRYCCHHKLGINMSQKELIEKGLYYDRPASELIFLEFGEHSRLHRQNLREETRKKLSDAAKGEKNSFYGKKHSEETRKKLSDAAKGRCFSDETKQKMSDNHADFKGENHPNAKQCTINGISYGCLKDAHKALYPNMPSSTFYLKYKEGKL